MCVYSYMHTSRCVPTAWDWLWSSANLPQRAAKPLSAFKATKFLFDYWIFMYLFTCMHTDRLTRLLQKQQNNNKSNINEGQVTWKTALRRSHGWIGICLNISVECESIWFFFFFGISRVPFVLSVFQIISFVFFINF